MDFSLFFDFVDVSQFQKVSSGFINHVDFFNSTQSPKNYTLGIVGVPEDRNSKNLGCAKSPDKIREKLYCLNEVNEDLKIIDFGNFKRGVTYKDTYIGIQEIISCLLKDGLRLIVLGGSQDLSFPIVHSLNDIKDDLSIVSVDSILDYGTKNNYNAHSIWKKIECSFKNIRLSAIGTQQYLCKKMEIDSWQDSFHSLVRLGKIRDDFNTVEPLVRDADFISFDFSAIRYSDAPCFIFNNPNGFYAEEACRISWISGLSDKVSVFGLFEVNPVMTIDVSDQLAAQIVWHFVEGFSQRKGDYPCDDIESYKTYIISSAEIDTEIVFYQSPKSNRWWMKINISEDNFQIISCSYNDYLSACQNKLPDIWMNEFNRLTQINNL